MTTTKRTAADTWTLDEFLAALRQVAQNAGVAEHAPDLAAEIAPAAAGAPLEADR
jgi:hypothetical protein